MHNVPPHIVTIDYIVGRLLQLRRPDNPITAGVNPSTVKAELEFGRDEIQRDLRALSHAPDSTAVESLQQQLEAIDQDLDFGNKVEATLEAAVEARRQENDTGVFTIVLRIEPGDIYEFQEGHFNTAPLYGWAKKKFGIEVPEWAPASTLPDTEMGQAPQSASMSAPNRDWSSVSIRLLPDASISYSINGGSRTIKHLNDTKFVDRRKKGVTTPNKSFELLASLAEVAETAKLANKPDAVGFCAGNKKNVSNQDRARKSKLCLALTDLVGLGGSPFTERTPDKGYQPHFTLEDTRHEAAQLNGSQDHRLESYTEGSHPGVNQPAAHWQDNYDDEGGDDYSYNPDVDEHDAY